MAATRSRVRNFALARAFELAARQLHGRAHQDSLYPAQWSSLRYFSTAPADRRTAIDLARYQGLAFGPVARTVRTLITRGLLRKAGSAGRGRAECIEVTEAGQSVLEFDPLLSLAESFQSLSDAQHDALAEALEAVLRALRASAPG